MVVGLLLALSAVMVSGCGKVAKAQGGYRVESVIPGTAPEYICFIIERDGQTLGANCVKR